MKRYVTATLYDNDYHSHLYEGVPYISRNAEHEDLTEAEFKEWLMDYVVFYSAIRVINRSFKTTPADLEHTRRYVSERLHVTFSHTLPEYIWQNSEFVMYDRESDYVWSV